MSRLIKFRAWDKANKQWFHPPFPFDSSCGGWLMTSDGRVYINGVYQELELEQFTGILDKNGREIYEGDILTANADVLTSRYRVEMRQGHAHHIAMRNMHHDSEIPYLLFQDACTSLYEVIGNIHEAIKS